ncbi:MAG: hypothetical protein BWY98_00387 [Tenericutes bacterium ADurb.BinA155]|nr:MAG: hypothetical protein BWY98_00387 [Tenericutes bacterium ADurb.BinA155]
MESVLLDEREMASIRVGEAITLGAVLAILAIAIVAVVVYKLFRSPHGSAKLPGGYAFEWK